MNPSIIRPLSALRSTDRSFSGGKGANLGELIAAGLPVPDGFVIGAAADDGTASALDAVRDSIVGSYAALGHEIAVAVRSSAVAEDGATSSFAGINETLLNVTGPVQLLAAVADCWRSARSARHDRYADARGLAAGSRGIAVVVQRQIASTMAGVVFTADPINGAADRLVIESARGLGEAVVSGLVTPDRIAVDKQSLAIISYDRGSQDSIVAIARDAPGTVERRPIDDETGQPTLSPAQVCEIARRAIQIERMYGSPQDIEWAFDAQGDLWILQARPITTSGALAARRKTEQFYDAPRAAGSRWTRANLGEALPGVPTPLTWSVWNPGLNEAYWNSQVALGIVPKRADRQQLIVTLARGWPAISVDLVERQLAQVPGMDADAFSRQFFGEGAHAVRASPGARLATALRMAARAPIVLARLGRRLRAASAASGEAWRRDAWQPASDPVALLTAAARRFRVTMAVHTTQTYVCQALYQAVERIAGALVIDLVSGDGDLAEARLAADLWRLAGGGLALDQFLRTHGFHGPNEGELTAPSWRQDPAPVLRAAREWAANPQARDPNQSSARRSEHRRECEARVTASMRAASRLAFQRLLAMTRRAVVAREVGKLAFLQDLDVARHALCMLGEHAAWHTLEELQAGVQLSPTEITVRQRVRAQFAASEPPLSFFGDASAPANHHAGGMDSVVTGIGASPGRTRGRARIVTDPTTLESALAGGDVLVARTTDPSWVTTFMTAGGMAIDVGGALSHAAIIARELGIPCVIGTGHGTRVIPDGAFVEIDGTLGTVRVIGPGTPAPGPAGTEACRA